MRTEIFYADFPVFSGLCPTPLISRSEGIVRNGKRWGIAEEIVLEGMISGCPDFSGMLAKQAYLLSGFSRNFQKLKIIEQGQEVYSQEVANIKSISFPDSKYAYILPFSITLECYPEHFFSGFYGVLEPQNNFSFSQGDGDVISVNHSVSARGFNTSTGQSDALQNAINFCSQHSGLAGFVPPHFISSGGHQNSILRTVSTNIDRLNASCSINESWEYDPVLGGTGILRYSSSFDSGNEEGVVKATLNGSIEGGLGVSLPSLRQRFGALNFYNIASGEYSKFFTGNLNTTELSLNIEENPFTNSITFSYQFDDDPRPNPFFTDSFSMNYDEINGSKSVGIEVAFRWRGNCKCNSSYGWNQIKNYASGFNYYQLAAERNNYYNSGTYLNITPVSSGISENKESCELVVSVEYEELDLNLIPPDPLAKFDYTIQIQPAIPQYAARPTICKGNYSIYDLNLNNRASFSINGSSLVKPCGNIDSGVLVTKCMIEQIASKFVSGQDVVLTSQSFQSGIDPDNRTMSFSYSWTAKIDPVFPNEILYV